MEIETTFSASSNDAPFDASPMAAGHTEPSAVADLASDLDAIRDVLLRTPGLEGQEGIRIHMPQAAGALRKAGYSFDRYGFEKARPYFDELGRAGIIAKPEADINPRSGQPCITVINQESGSMSESGSYEQRAARILSTIVGRNGQLGSELYMPKASQELRDRGIIYSDLGFEKAKGLFDDLVSKQVLEYPKKADGSIMLDGGKQPLITVAPAYRTGGVVSASSLAQPPERFFIQVRELSSYTVKPDFDIRRLLPPGDDFLDHVRIATHQKGMIEETLGPDGIRLIAMSYEMARAVDAMRLFEDKVIIPIYRSGFTSSHFAELSIKLDRDARGDVVWYVSHIEPNAPRPVIGKRKSPLESFAYMGPWNVTLNALSDMVLQERWSFDDDGRTPILRSYLDNTFRTLQDQGRIVQTDDMAAFDTGLYDRLYRRIYAVFVPNATNPTWKFADWAVAGQSRRNSTWGKRLLEFPRLPEPALYFENIDDMLYDTSRELYPDIDHILRDNAFRLTRDFLQRCTHDDAAIMGLYDEYYALAERERSTELGRTICHRLGESVMSNDRIHRELDDELHKAIDTTLRRITTDFRIAVPAYNPSKREHMFLMPLSLQSDASRIDAVLVATLTKSKVYQAQTIITNQMAYIDARLVSRIDTTWLPRAVGFRD